MFTSSSSSISISKMFSINHLKKSNETLNILIMRYNTNTKTNIKTKTIITNNNNYNKYNIHNNILNSNHNMIHSYNPYHQNSSMKLCYYSKSHSDNILKNTQYNSFNSFSSYNASTNIGIIPSSSSSSYYGIKRFSTSSLNNPNPNDNNISSNDNQFVQYTNTMYTKLITSSPQQLFHYSNYALLGLTPIALLLSPSIFNIPVDLALGIIIPYHSVIGINGIIEDYIPRQQQKLTKFVFLIVSVLATIGLLKINLCGAGITESVKSLWRNKPNQLEQIKIKNKKDLNNNSIVVVENSKKLPKKD